MGDELTLHDLENAMFQHYRQIKLIKRHTREEGRSQSDYQSRREMMSTKSYKMLTIKTTIRILMMMKSPVKASQEVTKKLKTQFTREQDLKEYADLRSSYC